jgi:hypothetical protein
MSTEMTAEAFVARLEAIRSPELAERSRRYFKTGEGEYGAGDIFMGVRMGQIGALAREFIDLPPGEIEKLLESPLHEVRSGGLSIMAKQARRKKTPDGRRKELFDLYVRRHDRINNWDLVDVSCVYVVGGYLENRPRDILYRLARSPIVWERRTAIVSTAYFLRQGDVADTFRIAEILLADKEDLIHKATGWLLREAGKQDRARLTDFLDQHATTMPRTALRYSLEHFDPELRAHYLSLKKGRQAAGLSPTGRLGRG